VQNSQQQMTPLTEKDLLYMKDMMSWELVAAKKAYQYAHQTMEPESKQLMFQIAQKHQQNVDRVLQHLGQHVTQTVQASVTVAGAQPTTTHM
jgi:hypothetical protein